MFTIKNILLVLHAIVLSMTLSIVVLPDIWMISVVGSEENIKGIVFPLIWSIYAVSVFVTSGLTFSWLVKKK
jgi:hypothetical protein